MCDLLHPAICMYVHIYNVPIELKWRQVFVSPASLGPFNIPFRINLCEMVVPKRAFSRAEAMPRGTSQRARFVTEGWTQNKVDGRRVAGTAGLKDVQEDLMSSY